MLQKQIIDFSEFASYDFTKKATVYHEDSVSPKAVLLYFHGGGLLYGNREDLPEKHLRTFTEKGYVIAAMDYPLAPAVTLPGILEDVLDSVNRYEEVLTAAGLVTEDETQNTFMPGEIPYFLWGRSAGAYLALLTGASEKLVVKPAGILSYYGYGFLTDGWYDASSLWYNSLPEVPESCLRAIPSEPHCTGPLETHYSVYVYARQKGLWKDLIYSGREKFFFIDYSLRLKDRLQAPLFCAHSTGDNDVPFTEFNALSSKYLPEKYIAAAGDHDFDRDEDSPFTDELLNATIQFMEKNL